MKSKLNKFLELTFKIGKVFSSILLVIVLLVMVGSGICLLTSDNAPLKTPSFDTLKQAFIEENTKSETDTNTASSIQSSSTQSSSKVAPYNNQIQKIIRKHHLEEEVKYLISQNIERINEELRSQYLEGLDRFYKDGLCYINKSEDYKDNLISDAVYEIEGQSLYQYYIEEARKNVKVNGTYNYFVSAGLTMKYHDLFINSLRDKAKRLQEKAMNKIANQIVFAVSILIFSILLFLPVLIKIEENTRPAEEKEAEALEAKKKEEDTKPCISCGKLIKTTAKKCRYCGTWQNVTKENNGGDE